MHFVLREEIFLFLVFHHDFQKFFHLSGLGEEYLALAVLNVLLYIEGYLLWDEEVLHVFRDAYTQVFAQREEIVNGMPGIEDNGRIVEDVDVLCPKFFFRVPFYMDEWPEFEFNIIFCFQIKVRGFGRSRGGLWNKNFFNFRHTSPPFNLTLYEDLWYDIMGIFSILFINLKKYNNYYFIINLPSL